MKFEEKEFTAALSEISNPILEEAGFEFFVESHGVKVYRQYSEESGLYKYKIVGEIDVNVETCAEVYLDLIYRKTWDTYANELIQCNSTAQFGEDLEVVYWEVKYPWPMSNRDYYYIRQMKTFTDDAGHKTWVILGRSELASNLEGVKDVPEKSGVIRVVDFLQSMVITKSENGGTRAFMEYYDDPRGSIPKWLINWGASNGVPDFLQKMQDACRGYKQWKSNQSRS